MPLKDTIIRNAKPKDKPYKLADEKGLHLLIKPAGKYFHFNYRFHGKQKTLAIGVYPEVRLAEAREKRDDCRKLLRNDIDPAKYKKEKKSVAEEQTTNSFEALALEWFTKNKHTWTEGHSKTIIRRLEQNIFPWLGKKTISSILSPELLKALRQIESRGALETAHRVKQN